MTPEERRTILLVEDEALIALNEQRILENFGYSVRVCHSGERAVEEACNTPEIDIVLMDIDLGTGIDGTEAARAILEQRELPIVFLTSHGERAMVEKVKGITRYGYVLKNAGEFVLREAITMALDLFHAHRSMEKEVVARRTTETELRNRNQFIETVLDNLPIGLAVNYVDEGTATYMNRKFEEIYGWPREIITDITSFFENVYPDPEYRQQLSQRIMEDIASGDPQRMKWSDIEIQREDGSTAVVVAQNIPILDQNFMISTVVDVSNHARSEEALGASESRYRALAKHFPNGMIALFDPELRYTAVSGQGLAETGLAEEDFVGKRLRDIFPGEIADRDEPALYAALAGETRDSTVPFGEQTFRVITGPVYDPDDTIIGGFVMSQDITELQRAQDALNESAQKLQLAVDTARLGIWTMDPGSTRTEWNAPMYTIYGTTPESFGGDVDAWRAFIHPDDFDEANYWFLKIREGDAVHDIEFRIVRPDGEVRYVLASGTPVFRNGTVSELIGINIDQTETQQDRVRLRDLLAQNELLMRESNHRVKNNLNMITSLLKLAEESLLVDLSNVIRQVDTIRIVHEFILKPENIDAFDVAPYIRQVIESATGGASQTQFQLSVNVDHFRLPATTAIPMGLVVNELVTNAVRHGVTGAPEDHITVSVVAHGSECRIDVENGGHPFPEGVDVYSPTSLGLQLINALVSQLHGSLHLERSTNTHFTVEFPLPADTPRPAEG